MTPKQAAMELQGLACKMEAREIGIWNFYNDALKIIQSQRAEAVADFKERILRAIDSQTHSSELGDAYRHIRRLVGMLPPAQEGEG